MVLVNFDKVRFGFEFIEILQLTFILLELKMKRFANFVDFFTVPKRDNEIHRYVSSNYGYHQYYCCAHCVY